jgi:UDP-GlcNAc:undecaprenyl-phosphate GlcNAc-1-phosphate transferase
VSPGLRYALAFGIPFLAVLVVTPAAGRLAHRMNIIDHPKQDRFHRIPTPYLGGLAIAVGLVAVGAITAGASRQLLTVLLCALGVGAIGFVDDWKSVGPLAKMAVEIVAGLALWFSGVSAGLFHVYVLDMGLTVLWIVAITNAMNLLDNMDGLSSGVAALAALAYFGIAAQRGEFLVGSFALALAGGSLGFLRYNFPPARIFLGDAGSLMMGFLLAALALKLDLVGDGGLVRAAVPALILGVPVFDTLLVILSRALDRRPIHVGGTDHSSHRLAAMGLSTRLVTLCTYLAQVACCAVALWLVNKSSPVSLVVVTGVALIGALGIWALLARPSSASPGTAGGVGKFAPPDPVMVGMGPGRPELEG